MADETLNGVCIEPGCQEQTLGRRQRCLVHWSARRLLQVREWNEKYGGPAVNIRRTEHTQNELSKQKQAYVDIQLNRIEAKLDAITKKLEGE